MQGISANARLLSVDATLSNPPCYPKRAKGTHRAAGTSLLPEAKHRIIASVLTPRKTVRNTDGFCCLDLLLLLINALLILLFLLNSALIAEINSANDFFLTTNQNIANPTIPTPATLPITMPAICPQDSPFYRERVRFRRQSCRRPVLCPDIRR